MYIYSNYCILINIVYGLKGKVSSLHSKQNIRVSGK